LYIWLCCLLLANQLLRAPLESGLSIETLVSALFERSAFYYLGWFAVVSLLYESKAETQSTVTDIALALAVGAFNFLPAYSVSWLSATVVGVFLLIMSQGDRKIQSAATVLLALSFNGLWGQRIFDIFAPYLLLADAALVGTLLSLTQPGMTWDQTIVGSPDGHNVFIYSACSSFHNISLGLLCWVAVTKLFRSEWRRQDALVALCVTASVIVLNAGRLYLMALSPEHFAYWHDGVGEKLVGYATTLSVLFISLWGATRVARQT
jgi:exosortase/archaeosortase family protein